MPIDCNQSRQCVAGKNGLIYGQKQSKNAPSALLQGKKKPGIIQAFANFNPLGQQGITHQETINLTRSTTAFINRPYH